MLRLSQRLSQFLRRLPAVDMLRGQKRQGVCHIVAIDALVVECLISAAARQKLPIRSRPPYRPSRGCVTSRFRLEARLSQIVGVDPDVAGWLKADVTSQLGMP